MYIPHTRSHNTAEVEYRHTSIYQLYTNNIPASNFLRVNPVRPAIIGQVNLFETVLYKLKRAPKADAFEHAGPVDLPKTYIGKRSELDIDDESFSSTHNPKTPQIPDLRRYIFYIPDIFL